jgi:hypothetical protein
MTAILIIFEGRFQIFQRFSSSKLVLKTVVALNYYENSSTYKKGPHDLNWGNVRQTIHLPSLPKFFLKKPDTPEGATFFCSSSRTARSKLLFMLPVEKKHIRILEYVQTHFRICFVKNIRTC